MIHSYLGPVVIDVAGTSLSLADKKLLADPWVGGVILFSRNFEHKEQLARLVADIRNSNAKLLLAVDHEGGRVQRFKEGFSLIPPMQSLGNLYSSDHVQGLLVAKEMGWLLAAEVLASDIDISFAPVLDVDDCVSDIIGDRSFHPDPTIVGVLAQSFMAGMHEAGMATTGKHFPGHGGIKADSHLELPVDARTLDELESRDLKPFADLTQSLDGVMPAHIQFPSIDGEPVGFSPWWLKTYLRGTLGYDGVIFSDDLTMEGAVGAGSYSQRAIKALQAGCDSVLVCNSRSGALEVVDALRALFPSVLQSNLEKMKARKTLTWGLLQKSERWRSAVSLLSSI
ncbi:beta-N-acetylhexosaminidase [Teredinibacter purpureus]|uniref:beta-N-acetylhexosaminidase n=1 Tax=Teredinibacter purpureus TaxID=2731756 RepID=UPI0005F79E0B|nr:beta-N-acetylhexosaminidase [Teredinibacter purpureus]